MSESQSPGIDLARLEVFFGESTPAAARVYARLPGLGGWESAALAGEVYGPLCSYARTLPTRIPLVDQGPGTSLLAQAIVVDPCFWSPQMPFLYEVTVRLSGIPEAFGLTEEERKKVFGPPRLAIKRAIGIRPLSVRARRLVYEGKSWVLRGASKESVAEFPVNCFRDVGAMLVVSPSDDVCRKASRIGVLLVARISGSPEHVVQEIRRLTDYPAVGFAVLTPDGELDESVRQQARNMLLAQMVVAGRPFSPAPWAQVAICRADDLSACADTAETSRLPLIALRRLAAPTTPHDARSRVDHLQRDLAGRGEFAGYLV